jgi:cell wall-associated NlpC family hydrolase
MALEWVENYKGLPFKHLGLSKETGIDCFNLIKVIYKEHLNIDIPYSTRDWCNIIDEDWYHKTHEKLIEAGANVGWEKISSPELFSVITMSMGTTTITNHCGMYLGDNKMLHIMQGHKSHVAVYGTYYKQYTSGIYKWVGV